MAGNVTRRGVLAAALAVPLATVGCKGVGGLGTPPRPLPDVAVLHAAIAAEKQMISSYAAILAAPAVTADPALAGELGQYLAQHQAHLAKLRARLVSPPATGGGPTATRAAHPGLQAPATPAAARAYLSGIEQAAAAALLRHLPAAAPSLAQLLASIAASEASHGLLLGPAWRAR